MVTVLRYGTVPIFFNSNDRSWISLRLYICQKETSPESSVFLSFERVTLKGF